jgi:hypothetical protein
MITSQELQTQVVAAALNGMLVVPMALRVALAS